MTDWRQNLLQNLGLNNSAKTGEVKTGGTAIEKLAVSLNTSAEKIQEALKAISKQTGMSEDQLLSSWQTMADSSQGKNLVGKGTDYLRNLIK